jgi:hypothetical protein
MKWGLFPDFADEDDTTKHTIAGHSDSNVKTTTIEPVIAQLAVLYSLTLKNRKLQAISHLQR